MICTSDLKPIQMNSTLQPRTSPGMGIRHNGLFLRQRINVVFISHPSSEVAIRNHMNSIPIQEKTADKSHGPITSEPYPTGASSLKKSTRFPESKALSGWQSPSEMFKNALTNAQHESDIFDASLRALTRRKPADNSMPELILVEFFVKLPEAKTVQLAADFTSWEESPVDMIRFDGGIWTITVPLPAGTYSYRFLVDGEWHDAPRAVRCDPHSTSVTKAFVQIR